MDRKCSNCGSPMIRTSNGYKCTFCSYVEPFNQTNKGYEPPKPNVPRNYRSDQFSGNNLKEFSYIAEKKKRGNKFIMGFVVAIFAAVFILRIISTIATYTLYDGYFETEKADSTYDEDYDTDDNAVTGELSTVKEEYWIQSPVMKQAVEDMFGKPFEEITKQDVETVRYMAVETSSAHGWCQISYSFEDYKDLSFLQGLTALKVLFMPACEITAIDNQTLAACTELEQLNLADNTVSSLDFVAGLANLKSVNIENCYVSDLLPLTFCEHLEYVNVKGNPISSNPLENVEVEE